MSEERKHHRYSPSTLQNREVCPCYETNSEGNEAAIAGTLAHDIVDSGEDNNELSDEHAAMAAECLDFVAERKRLMEIAREIAIQNLVVPNAGSEGSEQSTIYQVMEIKEQYLPIDDCEFPDGVKHTTAGYLDQGLIDHTGTYAEIADWKFGRWPVEEAENNVQGISYVLGFFRRFPEVQTVRFFFKQPQLHSLSQHLFRRSDIPALYLRIQTIVARARAATEAKLRDDFSAAKPTIPGCNFCSEIGRCPAVAAIAIKVGNKFHPAEIPDSITPTMLHDRKSASLGMRLAQVVSVWSKAFRAQVSDRVIRGTQDMPEGFMLQTMSRRELVDKAKFKQAALKHMTESEYADALDVQFGSIEKIINNKSPRGHKKETVDQFKVELENCGATKKGDSFTFLKASPETKT